MKLTREPPRPDSELRDLLMQLESVLKRARASHSHIRQRYGILLPSFANRFLGDADEHLNMAEDLVRDARAELAKFPRPRPD